jgi:hypothetical protein
VTAAGGGAGVPDAEFLVSRFGDKIRSAAARVRKDWRLPVADKADLEQEGFIWLYLNTGQVSEWLAGLTDDECSKRVYVRVRDVMRRWARAQGKEPKPVFLAGVPDHDGIAQDGARVDGLAAIWLAGANGELDEFALDGLCRCPCHSGAQCCWGKPIDDGDAHDSCACLDDDFTGDIEEHDCQLCPGGACQAEPCGQCDDHLFLPDAGRAAWGDGPDQPDERRIARREAFRHLSEVEQSVLWRRHRGESQAAIAADLGIDQSAVSRATQRANEKVLKAASEDVS